MFNSFQFNAGRFNSFGGDTFTGDLFSEGNYFFFNDVVLLDGPTPVVKTVRITTDVGLTISDEDDLFDSRTDDIDTWANFDGTDGDEGNVVVYYRSTQNTEVSPQVWGAWAPFHVAEVSAMGIEFKADLLSFDTNVNVLIDTLRIFVDEVS